MSARLSFVLVAVFCLVGASACDKTQSSAVETAAPVTSTSSSPVETPAATDAPEAPAPTDTFELDTAVKSGDTLASLRSQYGEANVVESELPGAEGETAQGWIIFPNDPEKKLMIYTDESNSHPGALMVDEANSKWHLSNTIKMGSDSTALRALNNKPFSFYGFSWDYGGVITDWNSGELIKKTANGAQINIHLCPPENPNLPENFLLGDSIFSSDNPWVIKFPPIVCKLGLYFTVEENK
jgi:hypothetical protein